VLPSNAGYGGSNAVLSRDTLNPFFFVVLKCFVVVGNGILVEVRFADVGGDRWFEELQLLQGWFDAEDVLEDGVGSRAL
jgi:hypothetical protein